MTPMEKTRDKMRDQRAEHEDEDALLDEALRLTFPASDPVAISFDAVSEKGRKASPATAGSKENE